MLRSFIAQALAVEHAADGIQVQVVCPGPVRTPMLHESVRE